ncbi:ABC transporter permease [Streptococcus suis]|nr:ABC transporter permease [Streptococcus suis]
MLGLTMQLARTNLFKNRRLYYPYAMMTFLSTAITYIFTSLLFHPDLSLVKGANGVKQVLGFGMVVVLLAVGVMIFYANGFIMKQRSKEFGIYSILGLEKKHLLLMNVWENLFFTLATVSSGLLLGIVLDKLFYALLLKIMQMTVVLDSTFQIKTIFLVVLYLFGIFFLVTVFNMGKLGMTDSLRLVQGKKRGDKHGVLLWLQTIFGLVLLGIAYTLAQIVTSPTEAIFRFFVAVILVIVATYLLFSSGTVALLNWLKKWQRYYYKPANFISVSNLMFRMRKNAIGLATITILSTMFLVTLLGGLNIYIGGKDYIANQNPNDFSIDVGAIDDISDFQIQEWGDQILEKSQIPVESKVTYTYQRAYFSKVTDKKIDILTDAEHSSVAYSDQIGVGYVIDRDTYQKMTGETLELTEHQLAIYSKGVRYHEGQEVTVADRHFIVNHVLNQNVTLGHLPDHFSFILSQYLVLVVDNLDIFKEQIETRYYMGYESHLTEEEQVQAQESFLATNFESELWDKNLMPNGLSVISLAYRAYATRTFFSWAGSLFFIGLLLSLIFFMAVVLVIYFKQISEGFEDRSRFVIMTKVGLDEDQTRQSIRKQLLTVFFLPLILAFIHLGFSYKMLSAILLALGVVNAYLMFIVTCSIGVCYLLVYLLIYLLTTRVYKKIILM